MEPLLHTATSLGEEPLQPGASPAPASHRARTISQLNIVTVKNLPPIIINNKEAVTIENFCHSFLPFDTAHILWQPVAGSGCQTCFIQSFY